jgi:glycosyltransferase involved in cell wall biosynthesis
MAVSNQTGKKRVLMIAPTPFFADRGCHVRIFEEVQSLKVLGYHVIVCTYHLGRNIAGVEIKRSLRIPWYTKLSAGPSIHKFYADLFLLWTVLRTCLQEKPDLIHAHLHEGVLIGKIVSWLLKVPLVADLQGSLTAELLQHRFIKADGLWYRIFQRVERLINRLPAVTLLSSSMPLYFSSEELSQKNGKPRIIPDGVDTERFRPGYLKDGLSQQLGIPLGVKVVGFIGMLTDYQGVPVLLQAIPHVLNTLPAAHFLIMGYPNVEYYKDQARLLGISQQVTFTGRVPYEEVPRYLGLCDVGVAPKLFTPEANGKLLNYMAMGLPIVASDTPVNREMLGDLGVYAEAGDPVSLARALLLVLSDEQHAADLGAKLREQALVHYSWRAIGERIAEVYGGLIREMTIIVNSPPPGNGSQLLPKA